MAKRNARERRRVQAVNSAFARLRKCVPVENRNKRLSKVKTLHKAIEYISQLQEILNTAPQPTVHPSNHQSATLNSNHNCHSLSGLNDFAENSASSDQLSSSNHHAGIRSMDCNYLTSGYSQSFASEHGLVGEASTNKENVLDSKWIKTENVSFLINTGTFICRIIADACPDKRWSLPSSIQASSRPVESNVRRALATRHTGDTGACLGAISLLYLLSEAVDLDSASGS